MYLFTKAFHIIFVVTWFSGMFYLVRLFIYNREAQDKPETEKTVLTKQFSIMIKRLLFGITWPSAILTSFMGYTLLYLYPSLPTWLIVKIILANILFLYHLSLHTIYKQQANGNFKFSSTQLRLWNEVATIFLVGIVLLVVVKDNLSMIYGLIGLIIFALILMITIRIYKTLRKD
jgi:putative membrane protein